MHDRTLERVHRYFATTVALVTSSGTKYGQNVMAAEWAMQVSYDPMLLAIFVHKSPTYWNIKESKVFGVNIASDDQAELVNLAGGYSGTEINKLQIPAVFPTYRGHNIEIPMIKGCALNAECVVTEIRPVGDHIMVIGKVVEASFDEAKLPLIYTRGNYRRIGRSKIASGRKRIRLEPKVLSEFERLASGQFVLRTVACDAEQAGKRLLQRFGDAWIAPFAVVRKGENYPRSLEAHLESIGHSGTVGRILSVVRVILTDGRREVRANFVVFRCDLDGSEGRDTRWFEKLPKATVLKALFQDS